MMARYLNKEKKLPPLRSETFIKIMTVRKAAQ